MRKVSKFGDFSGPYTWDFELNTETLTSYSAQIWENTNQKNSKFGNSSRSNYVIFNSLFYEHVITQQPFKNFA